MFMAFLILESLRLFVFLCKLAGQAIFILFLPVRALFLLLVHAIKNHRARKHHEESR